MFSLSTILCETTFRLWVGRVSPLKPNLYTWFYFVVCWNYVVDQVRFEDCCGGRVDAARLSPNGLPSGQLFVGTEGSGNSYWSGWLSSQITADFYYWWYCACFVEMGKGRLPFSPFRRQGEGSEQVIRHRSRQPSTA